VPIQILNRGTFNRNAIAEAGGAATSFDARVTVGASPPPASGSALAINATVSNTAQQSAVALTAADGETISGDSQSNFLGNGWWTRNGFTRGRDWTGPKPGGGNYAGFDDVNFMPVVTWLTDFGGDTFYSRMDDLGLNGMLPAAGSISLANNITFGKWAVATSESHAGGSISSADDPGVIGVSTGEEPSTIAEYDTINSDADAWLATSDGPGRIHLFNFADNLLNGDIANVYFPADMVIAGNWTTCDQYWYAGADDNSLSKLHFRMYDSAGNATFDQCSRGSHYGSMMDSIRKNYPVNGSQPTGAWIENGAPYEGTSTFAITPAQMKWAVWSTIVHGARGIYYFNHTFRISDPGAGANNFNNNFYGGPGITGTGIYAAAKEINLNALSIAPVINAPFDGYFVWGDGNAASSSSFTKGIARTGFLTAVTSANARSQYAGVDAACRWQPLTKKHWILSSTRESGGATNISATYRMVDQGQTSAYEFFEDRTISISRGGAIPAGFCEFTDTFATAASYHCYRID
jgi:hypothetical protein